jgi:phytoene dehydrogenase-like protein
VTVVDRGYQPGGHGWVFTREGYEFDVGLHYLGSARTGEPATKPLLDPLGVEITYLQLEPTDTVVTADGQRFEVLRGLDAFREALHAALPGEHDALDRYLRLIDDVDGLVAQLASRPSWGDIPATLRQSGVALRHARDTLGGYWDQHGFSPRARTLLGWMQGTYAVVPSEASLLYHAIISMHYVNGAWYPQGGGGVISQRLADVITEHGGQFRPRHEVTGITVENGHVTGITAVGPDGDQVTLTASAVVAAGDIKRPSSTYSTPPSCPASCSAPSAATRWHSRWLCSTWLSTGTSLRRGCRPPTTGCTRTTTCRVSTPARGAVSSPRSRSCSCPRPA